MHSVLGRLILWGPRSSTAAFLTVSDVDESRSVTDANL
jgi:hypothetical protein